MRAPARIIGLAAALAGCTAFAARGQQSPFFHPTNLPAGGLLGTSTQAQTAGTPDDWLDRAERERRESEARAQFETTVLSLAEEKGEQEYAKEAAAQAEGFSKEFLKLDLDAPGFVDRFEGLLEKFPLAIEDPFTAKLIRKGENAARRADPDRARARLEKTRTVAKEALEEHIRVLREQNPTATLEADARYIQLREALDRAEAEAAR